VTQDTLRDPSDRAYALARGTWRAEAVRATKLEMPATRAAAARARREIETHFGGLLDAPRLQEVQLVVTELITNVVLHSGSDAMVLRMAAAPELVRVEVCDQGAGFDPEAVTAREGGGFGLMLVERLAAQWGTAVDGEACVWVEMEV